MAGTKKQTSKGKGSGKIAERKRPTDTDIRSAVKAEGPVYTKVVARLRKAGFPLSHWFRGEYDRVLKGMDVAPKAPFKKPGASKATPTMANPTGKPGPSRRELMAKASDKLKSAGRYSGQHKITITDENLAMLAGAAVSEIKALPEEQPEVTTFPKTATKKVARKTAGSSRTARRVTAKAS
jgi:hypothetical protein